MSNLWLVGLKDVVGVHIMVKVLSGTKTDRCLIKHALPLLRKGSGPGTLKI